MPIGTALLLLAASCFVGACSANDRAASPAAAATGASVPVDAKTLMSDYDADDMQADAKWKGNRVVVNGIVDDVRKDAFGGVYILLGTGSPLELNAVHCEFRRSSANAPALAKGERVTLNGKVGGMVLHSVVLRDAELASN
jgi:putative nucleic acid binding protein